MKIKRLIQILIGILFLLSGFLKALDSKEFVSLIVSYGLGINFGIAQIIAPLISGFEILLALFLILNIKTRITSLVVAVITSLFTLAYLKAYFIKGIEDCGCLGSFIEIPPYISFARNILIIAGGLWIWKNEKDESLRILNWKKWVICMAGSISFCLAGFTSGITLIEKNKIREGDQIGSTLFRYYNDINNEDLLIVFIFSPNCNHCWNTTENVKSIKRQPDFNEVIGITFRDVDLDFYYRQMQPNFPIIKYPTYELNNSIKEIPVLLILKKGKIIKIFKSHDIPCGNMLKMMKERGWK